MNQTYSSNPSNKPSRKKIESPENFLEALRDLGKSTVSEISSQAKTAFTQDIPEAFGLGSSGGTLQPNESFNLSELKQAENRGFKKAESQFGNRLSEMRQMERSRLLKEESEAKKQIQAIREDIANLAKSMGDFAQEIQIATMQAPTNPGVYHKNFYAHLRSVIRSLQTRVESSKNWLASSNSRAAKKGFYWSQVKSSGTKFMLSSERYMVTSTG